MSLISLSDLLRRKDSVEQVYADLDNNIEEVFADQLDASVESEIESESEGAEVPLDGDVDEMTDAVAAAQEAPADVLTGHAQNRMAAFRVFDDANRSAREELALIGKAFTQVVTSYNLGRAFLDDCEDEIVRASDLEQNTQRLTTENRRLLERVEKLERARERQDDLVEAMKRREARLVQDADGLRENLAELRMELVEARNANSSIEAARSELHLTLAGRTADLERIQREVESLREKNVVLSMDLENAQKKHTEMRRKVEEFQTNQTSEASRFTDLSNKLAAQEKEILRLQRQSDTSEAHLTEANDARRLAEQETREAERRHQSELQTLRLEIEQWKGRLQSVAATHLTEAARPRAEEQPNANGTGETVVVERRKPRLIDRASAS